MATMWDPKQYSRFTEVRTRPAHELIARIPLQSVRSIADLGCGEGAVTRLLCERWPEAQVVGVDSSPAMLASARIACPCVGFVEADISRWTPDTSIDLIFSNAALQWVDNHPILMPRLFTQLPPGGVFAVQMPGNFDAPSHRALIALAQSDHWRAQIGHLVRPNPVAAPTAYLDFLGSDVASFDSWETTDHLMLDGKNPVLEWMKGTALRPYLGALTADDAPRFTAELASRLANAYPPQPDGRTLFPFRRIYFVATRR